MSSQPPLIDKRTYDDLVAEVEDLAEKLTAGYGDGWRRPDRNETPDAGWAVIRLFSRMAELVIARINRIPEKSFLAFLDLIGTRLEPPQPARVPLTFHLAAGSPTDALVPAGTQVAATPFEGEKEAPVFETQRDLLVTRSRLVAVWTREPELDIYANYTAFATGLLPDAFDPFHGDRPIGHALYVGHTELLGLPSPKEVRLLLTATSSLPAWLAATVWEVWDGLSWRRLTAGVLAAGADTWKVVLPGIPAVPVSTVAGRTSSWLRGRLDTPLPEVEVPLPWIETVRIGVAISQPAPAHLVPDLGFSNQVPVDFKTDFFLFGERPRAGDAFYLACDEAFSRPGAQVTLHVVPTSVPADPKQAPPPYSDDLELAWQFWNGHDWQTFGSAGPFVESTPDYDFVDGTNALQGKGNVTFKCPPALPVEVGGQTRRWLRIRIESGNYGVEASYKNNQLQEATFRPPSLRSLRLGYTYTLEDVSPEHLLVENDFTVAEASSGFSPFLPSRDARPTLYLGFERPGDAIGFANRPVALYFAVAAALYDPAAEERQGTEGAVVVWEYWNGGDWQRLGTRDETRGFTRRGMVTFIGPSDFQASSEFGIPAFWLRACWQGGEYADRPELRRILTNTVWALHAQTVSGEVLGSGRGEPGQTFRTRRAPVLSGQRLEVSEPERPSAGERAALEDEEGEDAVTTVLDAAGQVKEVRVRWHEVPDFHASGPRSRHYTLDRLNGVIRCGDGRHGMVPPPGRNNVRLARYQAGGGLNGNRPAGNIMQLKGTVPYVDGVTNLEAAAGGAAEESLENARLRGPKALRHSGRATALADFEDLALQASSQVARVQGIAARDYLDAGRVGLIVVPNSTDARPVPNLDLLERVRAYVEARLSPVADLWVAGPDWLQVTIEAEIVPRELEAATDVQNAALARLAAFLHPLTGGLDGGGWAFGRKPHRSDLYALLASVPGVDHVRRLEVQEEAQGGARPGRFLIFSGTHRIAMTGPDDAAADGGSTP